ncbi:MAG: sigma-70 family RNA polymerase sigma factor [Actinomycetota bacterium]|nr:sigma-70 family RNA polymerase sigma factor [Actinomycetota bacterium]
MTKADLAIMEPAVSELFEDAAGRGYLLTSELDDEPELTHGGEWGVDLVTVARHHGIEVVDDVGVEDEAAGEAAMTVSDDPVRAYLDAAGRYPLLTAEEEADLAKRYQAGLAAQRILGERVARGAARRARLQSIRRDGERARERLIRHNLRLVVPQAKKWLGRDIDLIELIQEGNLGLIRAVEKFDHTKGYKFSTYAVWWIRQALQRGVSSKARTIRVPTHIWETAAKLRRAEADLRQRLGHDPTDEEIALALNLSVERVQEVREALRHAGSLDQRIGEDGGATLGDLLPDAEATDPLASVSETDARARVEGVLRDLDERERAIVDLRFGFTDGQPHTLAEIGERFGMSRERIRQLEKQALAKLRHPSTGEDLASLLEALAA